MFSTSNSGRKIVTDSPHWKSRSLDLGNRHRTTLNFGDLVPAYWQHVQPGDKLRLDASVLAKFLPLIAPAFSRMKIKTEWFYVPLRQISQPAVRALQDFNVEPLQISDYFSQLLSGFTPTDAKKSLNQQIAEMAGFPCIPSWVISTWLSGETVTRFFGNSDVPAAERYFVLGSDTPLSSWRGKSGFNRFAPDFDLLGYENISTYSTKRRISRFLSYLGLPSRLTQMRYTTDVLLDDGTFDLSLLANVYDDSDNYKHIVSANGGSDIYIDSLNVPHSLSDSPYVSDRYLDMVFADKSDVMVGLFLNKMDGNLGSSYTAGDIARYCFASNFPNDFEYRNGSYYASSGLLSPIVGTGAYFPIAPSNNHQLISLLPAQAYQKIYNDFYRDEKLQEDEIRYFPNCYLNQNGTALNFSGDANPDSSTPFSSSAVSWEFPYNFLNNLFDYGTSIGSMNVFFNNLFMLRRRNRAKDVLSSSVTSRVVFGQRNSLYNDAKVTVYDANLSSKLARFFMKKEFTGSTWAEWLSNFFGVNSNDLLNNNVIFLGGKESVVGISENIQQSSSTEVSAQGNRAGLAADFHNGSEIYFRVPDFGIVMCIVSVIPDDLDNFNGLQERFVRQSVFDWNLPDFQNLGFSPVFNQRANIGFAAYSDKFTPPAGTFPNGQSSQNYVDSPANPQGVFGYQPFGYHHTYTPNIISGDLQSSLRYWHQSPDLDFDFSPNFHDEYMMNDRVVYSQWANSQLALNANLPTIGLRQLPLGASLSSQYYNNVFAVTNDESGDHIVADMRFFVTCHRNTAFFTDAVGCEE